MIPAMKTASYPFHSEVPVIATADVVVVGGGPGGLGAAVMAARRGARVMLVERYGHLGGMAVTGEVHPFMVNHVHGQTLDRPVYTEWIARMHDYLPPAMQAASPLTGEGNSGAERMISKDLAMLAMEDLCLEAGVELLYHHALVDAVCADRRIKAAIVHSKSGLGAIEAPVFVDATGDADLAARAGCRTEVGGPTGHCQPMTLCFKLGHVDVARMPPRSEINAKYLAAVARGDIDCPRENVLLFTWIEPDVLHFNTTRVVKHSAVDGLALSEAEILGRRQMRQYLRFLRREIPGFEQATLFSVAHHIGVRESRRVVGRVMLRREAFTRCQKFDDAIARVRYSIDIHNPDGKGTEIEGLPEGEWYEIPYGCIVPADVDNLLVAGRPISVDHAIHSSMRVMPPAVSVGQAAGMAAAMALQQGCAPGDLDGCAVREALRAAGANL
jgi:glycine/D-amino acid oxidase-like deaminating enzyme